MLETMTTPYNTPYYNPTAAYQGMQYAQIKRPSMSQPLTAEQMQLLASKGGAFSTRVSQVDLYRSYCTHKKDGNIVLNNNGDGTFTCPICQETFAEVDLDQAHVKEVTREMINILQMIKTCYMDIPEQTAVEYFPIIPLLEKTPELAEIAMRNFSQYEQGTMVQAASNPYGFGALNSLMGAPMAYPGMTQQPMYQPQPQFQYAQPQQPMYAPQPQFAQMAPPQVQVTPQFMPNNEFGAYVNAPTVSPMAMQYQQPQPQQPMYQPVQQPQAQPQQGQVQQQPQAQPQQTTVDVSTFSL